MQSVKKFSLHRTESGDYKLEKNIEVSLLFDFYGQLLSDRQQKAVSLYYNDDLSLSEIALQLDITRQGVRDSIKHGENRLYDYEKKLGLFERFKRTESALLVIESLAKGLTEKYDKASAKKIIEIAESLHE